MSTIDRMEEDCDDKDDTKSDEKSDILRKTRNLSEKKRRDQFNMLVNELSSMISTNNRKMDKSTVLKSTISFLKKHNEITVRSRAHDVHEEWKPAFLANEEFTYLILEALEGFIMVFSTTGRIYYVSESITSLLGHNPVEVVNKNLFDFTYEDDQPNLYSLLQISSTTVNSGQNSDKEINFQCHLRRAMLDFRDETTYELIQFSGHFRSHMDQIDNEDTTGNQQEQESRILFVCIGRLYTPQLIRDVSLVDASRCEFMSRHSLEWKFLFLDHRAPPIIGYLPFEVLGTSGYDYYHYDDLEKVVTCHEELMQKGETTSCYYRFLTKGQQWIWLQTRFYITYHQWNSKPEFVVCTHRVVSYSDLAKITKQENSDGETMSETENRATIKDSHSADAMTNKSSLSDRSDNFTQSYQSFLQGGVIPVVLSSSAMSNTWLSETQSDYTTGSDSVSIPSDSRRSKNQSGPEMVQNIGTQYLDPVPYIEANVSAMLPLPITTLPMILSPDQAQVQEQLQRKHEELQQMIVRQQEELRQVKEQLLFARLGILQPIINDTSSYTSTEDITANQRYQEVLNDESTPRAAVTEFSSQQPPYSTHNTNMPQ